MKKFQLSTLGLLFVFLASCKKEVEKLPPRDENGYIWLRNVQSLPLIKQTIRGNWKIHYAYGGLTGKHKTELHNSWFRYLPNDSLYLILEGKGYAATRSNFIYKKTEFNFNAWILDFEINNAWGLRDELYPSFIYNDTLSLGQNSVDPISYRMTKIK